MEHAIHCLIVRRMMESLFILVSVINFIVGIIYWTCPILLINVVHLLACCRVPRLFPTALKYAQDEVRNIQQYPYFDGINYEKLHRSYNP